MQRLIERIQNVIISISDKGRSIPQHLVLDGTTARTSTTTIEEGEFTKSRILETVKILESSNINCIGDRAFGNCRSLRTIDLPESVTNIGNSAFDGCSSLLTIDLPESLTNIGVYAFYGCSSLQTIDLPEGVTNIGLYAFFGCSSLRTINLPESLTNIGGSAFDCCSSLQTIDIPESVTHVEYGTFYGCTSLRTIDLPESLANIGDKAFYGCSSLQLIEIPGNVTNIRSLIFHGCTTLQQRQTNGTNYHPYTETWLRQRFNNLPIHRACYHSSNALASLNPLSTLIQQNKQTLTATDAMGMTPLHILCCKPNSIVELIQALVEGEPSVLTQRDVTQSTPLQQFLKCRNLLEAAGQDAMPPLHGLLESGMKSEDLDILLILDNNQEIDLTSRDEKTGLLPYMSAAVLSTCGLDLVYTMAMHTNLGTIS